MMALIATKLKAARSATIAVLMVLTVHGPAYAVDVVELFTSQGCSACPAADRILGQLARKPDIIALSFNVDYWDYLGWKDTLASHANTLRQYAYARARGDRRIYTPQAIINGRDHVVGSDASAIDGARRRTPPAIVASKALSTHASADGIVIDLAAGPAITASVTLIAFAPNRDVAIRRGENRGQTVTYHNVVRAIVPVGKWRGQPARIQVKRHLLPRESGLRYAVIVQHGDPAKPGPIILSALVDHRGQ